MLKTDWAEYEKLQKRKVINNRCRNYLSMVQARKLPICDIFYDFIFNPDGK